LLCQKFTAESVGEIISTIGQHLAKLEAKYSGTFFRTPCISDRYASAEYATSLRRIRVD